MADGDLEGLIYPADDYLSLLGRYFWEVQNLEGAVQSLVKYGNFRGQHLLDKKYREKTLGQVATEFAKASSTMAEGHVKAWFAEVGRRLDDVAEGRNAILHSTPSARESGERLLFRSRGGKFEQHSVTELAGERAGERYREWVQLNERKSFFITEEFINGERVQVADALRWLSERPLEELAPRDDGPGIQITDVRLIELPPLTAEQLKERFGDAP